MTFLSSWRLALPSSLASAVTLAAFTLSTQTALANTVEYCDFTSVAGLKLNGNAAQVGTTLRMTQNVANQDSSAFYTTALPLTATTDFHTHFQFILTPGTQADGVSFVIQGDARGDAALGGNGGGIGYGGENGGTAIAKSVIIEFDTFQNGWDPNNNHVGVMTNGADRTHVAVATPAFTMASNVAVDAWVDYVSATTTLSVFLSNAGTGVKPATALLTTNAVNVFTTVGANAFVGVTGSTGGSTEAQVFNMWILNVGSGLSECSCTTNNQCAAPTPVCETPPGVCVQCTSNANCGGATPVCDTTTHTCVQCTSDANCGGTTPVCNTTTNTCGPCTSNADCGGTTPYCAPIGDPLAGACVACVTDAECDSSPNTATPICNKTGGSATTDTCVACSTSLQCVAATLEPVCVTSGAHDGQCAQCATNANCTVLDPVCVNTGATNQCEQCATNANCSGATPICNTTTWTCGPCTSDTQCAAPTPACQTSGTLKGECTQCSATNTSQCTGADPVCNTTTGTCVACDTDANCSGTTPLCVANVCVGCTSDYTPTNPPPRSCPTSLLPACQTTGTLAGECTQCSATNGTICAGLPTQPVCVTAKEECGCTQNSDCGTNNGMICDTATPPAGKCVAGCVVTTGGSNCPAGEVCVGGQCTTSDGGTDAGPTDAGADASDGGSSSGDAGDSGADSGPVSDSGADGAPSDGGNGNDGSIASDGGNDSGSGNDGGEADSSTGDSGQVADATTDAEGDGSDLNDPGYLGGGGCAIGVDPASSLATWCGLGMLFVAAGVARRRRRG